MRSRSRAGVLAFAASLTLVGCSGQPGASVGGDDTLTIVASTDVYGDIATRIAGDLAEVTSIISGSAQDPHSYEATARDQLTLSSADLVIENGGGYDPFIDSMLYASGGSDVVVITAAQASGLLDPGEERADEHAADDHDAEVGHDHIEGFNEHVWYSFHGVEAVADEIAHELGEIDESNAGVYEENLDAFVAEIGTLEERAETLRDQVAGRGAAVTEPVPDYLLAELGFENLTPPEFSEAVEEGSDVAPAVLQETLDLIADGSVSLLAYNEQTTGPITEQVLAAAEDAGVAVVSMTETLPDGDDYVSWMTGNLDSIEAALA